MAEEKVDLDDFFAKRDKKKKSGKKKYETTEELAKILGKRTEERKKLEEGKSQYVVEGEGIIPTAQNEDDEWLEQKEDTVDLTGLKVTELILPDEEEEEIVEGKDPETTGVTTDGPWRKREKAAKLPPQAPAVPIVVSESTTENEDPENPVKEEVKPSEEEAERITPTPAAEDVKPPPSAGGPAKYVPPALKKAMAAAAASGGTTPAAAAAPAPPRDIFEARPLSEPSPGAVSGGEVKKGAYVPPGRREGSSVSGAAPGKPRKAVAAPNIHDEEYFPSLGAS